MNASKRIHAALLALVCIVTVDACAKNEKQSKGVARPAAAPAVADERTEPAPAAAGGPTTTVMSAPIVKLLAEGSAPRRPLRIVVERGHRRNIVMTMRMGMEMQLGSVRPPSVRIPPMQMTISAIVDDVSANGDISYRFELTRADVVPDPGAEPLVATTMQRQLDSMVGMAGGAVVSNRGVVRSARLTLPPNLEPQLQQMLEGLKDSLSQLSAPFPEEAVGRGARWTVSTALTQQGMTLTQIASYQLVSLEGDRVKAEVTIAQKAEPQEIHNPSLPPGTKLMLLAMDSTGAGSVALDLRDIAPVTSKVAMKSSMEYRAEMGAQTQAMSMKMDMEMEITGQKP